jgi:ABC-type multidrug transport system ATPase subunit
MPSTKSTKLKDYDWVILEELEMGLHPRAVSTMLMLVLELLHRGYRVCLSSHSPQVLELVWAWQNLMMNKAEPRMLARILNAKMTGGVRSVVDDAMKKELRVYYFDHNAPVAEISGLDTDSPTEMEASWGDMLSFSDRANRAVAESASENSGHDSSSLDEEDDAE